jgi:hypothetical protein
MKTVKPISPRNQEWCEKQRKFMEEELYLKKPFEYYKARQAFEVDLIMDAALDKAIEENDIQYIIKHKELEAAEKQAKSLEFMAESLYSINLNYERNFE